MRRVTALVLLLPLLGLGGCALSDAFFSIFNDHYSAGRDFSEREEHYDRERDRWRDYQP